MKKILLTAFIAFCTTMFASAQFMIVTTYDGDKEDAEQITCESWYRLYGN